MSDLRDLKLNDVEGGASLRSSSSSNGNGSEINGGTLPEVVVTPKTGSGSGSGSGRLGDICSRCGASLNSSGICPKGCNVSGSGSSSGNSSTGSGSNYGSGYLDGYLTAAEKEFIKKHPIAAAKFFINSQKASSKTASEPGQHNGKGDALRHAYWCALNARDEGVELAKKFGNAHEDNPNNPPAEKQMDLHNNEVGYSIGNQARSGKWSDTDVYKAVNNAYNSGRLRTL